MWRDIHHQSLHLRVVYSLPYRHQERGIPGIRRAVSLRDDLSRPGGREASRSGRVPCVLSSQALSSRRRISGRSRAFSGHTCPAWDKGSPQAARAGCLSPDHGLAPTGLLLLLFMHMCWTLCTHQAPSLPDVSSTGTCLPAQRYVLLVVPKPDRLSGHEDLISPHASRHICAVNTCVFFHVPSPPVVETRDLQ